MTSAAYLGDVGKWMRRERKRLGLKQATVAEAMGVSDTTVCNWEQGRTEMGVVDFLRLRALFREAGKEGISA